MSVSERHKIQVGLEFEFIVPEAYRLSDNASLTKLGVSTMSITEITNYLRRPDGSRVPPELFRYNAWTYSHRFSYIDFDDPPKFSNAAKTILFLRLRPAEGFWYTNSKGRYLDRTDKIQNLIDTTDLDNPDEVKTALRSISRCYIDGFSRQFGNARTKIETDIISHVAERISAKLGVQVNGLTDDYVEKNRGGTYSYEFLENVGKRKPDWYLSEEDSLNGINDVFFDMGLELITPVLHPDIAMEYTRLFLEMMRDSDRGFDTRLNYDCGIHMNISHVDQTYIDMSPTYIALMLDYEYYLRRFNRINTGHPHDYRGLVLETVRALGQKGIIGMDLLSTNPRMLLDMIDSNVTDDLFYVVEFSKAHKYNYIEYRFMGGERYPDQYPLLQSAMEDLINITSRMSNPLNDPFFMKALRDIMIEAEVPETSVFQVMLP